ncbi:phasin family protein [Parvularcula sp. ZS-1/3]|uniref:Phasin family protein n=1 Tax=Parvularcula mediterranea TaxID=2732508 RepID=A0A7Y3W582_9PROT|nr:phasin family protein [Parvularcula mediterranea]NNU16520.1 phasin family protein [Parvularcula mediterranea]
MSATRKTTAKATEAANESVFTAANTAQASINEGVERMTKGMTQMGSFAQDNTEAVMQAASVVAKGMEKVTQENVDYAKSQFETAQDKVQALTKAKTPQEFFEAQSELFRTSMEAQISQVNKVSDMMIATAKDAAQPLSKRYSAMVELMQQR